MRAVSCTGIPRHYLQRYPCRSLVNIRARFANPLNVALDAIVEVPMQERNTTISSATAYLADGRAVDTQVVDTPDAA